MSTTIEGNARFRESTAAKLVIAYDADGVEMSRTEPDAESIPTPGNYKLTISERVVLLQAHAFGPEKLTGPWRASTVYAVGDIAFQTSTDADSLVLECTAVTGSAESGASEPTWDSVVGNTTTDNEVTWETLGTVAGLTPLTQWHYQAVLLSAVDPATGSVDGGTNLSLTGAGLSAFNAGNGDTITVGGSAATNITVVSDTEITFDTPPGTGGSVNIVVTIGGESVTLSGGFAYQAAVIQATGGTETIETIGGTTYRIHTFSSSGAFNVTEGGEVEYLIVGGGGAGGANNTGAGGGAGEFVKGSTEISSGSYSVVVGGGGEGRSSNGRGEAGQGSSIFGVTAIGGGGGGGGRWTNETDKPGGDGGSGGGGGGGGSALPASAVVGGESIAVEGVGHDGGNGTRTDSTNSRSGGGGGGAGSAGANSTSSGGNGGAPVLDDFDGAEKEYAAGGGGATNAGTAGSGGGSVGGKGGNPGGAESGVDGTGSGGGGLGERGSGTAGDGGDGIVIIRYPI